MMCLVIISCGKGDDGYESQVTSIKEYVSSQIEENPEYTATYSGDIARLTIQQGEGNAVTEDGLVKMFYAGYVFNKGISSSSLFATNHRQTAQSASWVLSGVDYDEGVVVDLSDKNLIQGLRKGQDLLSQGNRTRSFERSLPRGMRPGTGGSRRGRPFPLRTPQEPSRNLREALLSSCRRGHYRYVRG